MRSTDHGVTWSDISTGPSIESIAVTDPDTGALVRDGDGMLSIAADPTTNGRLYAVWQDGRFSGSAHSDVALSVSSDGGLTWSDPIKVNQAPTNIPAGDQQAFTPVVAVNSAGTVAVTYYDFRNNDANPGLPTDYWLVHASSNFTDPSSWTGDEKRLTTTSFNMENAPPTDGGDFFLDRREPRSSTPRLPLGPRRPREGAGRPGCRRLREEHPRFRRNGARTGRRAILRGRWTSGGEERP